MPMPVPDKMELLKLAAQITAAWAANDPQGKIGSRDTAIYLEAVYQKLLDLYKA